MTHGFLTQEEREELGINDNFIRLSVGIEDKHDLINDLNQALKKATGLESKRRMSEIMADFKAMVSIKQT